MKTSYKLGVIALLMLAGNTFAQQSTDSFSFIGNRFDQDWKKGTFKLEGDAFAGSNALNTNMYSDVLFRTSFTPKAKQEFLDGSQSKLNLFAQRFGKFEYKLDSNKSVYLKYNNAIGFSSDKDFAEMLFFGNAAFAGQEITSKNTRFIQSTSFSGGVFLNLLNSEKWRATTGFGLNFITNYRAFSAQDMSLFTAEGGSYIDANIGTMSITENGSGLRGIGIDINQKIEYSINDKNRVSFEVSGLNINYLIDQTVIEIDTSLRFSGVNYDFINDDSTSIGDYIDSSFTSIVDNGRNKKKWAVLPSAIVLVWNKRLSDKTILVGRIRAVDLGLYGVTGSLGVSQDLTDRLRLQSTLGYGNFTSILWQESIEYRTRLGYHLFAGFSGIDALVIPKISKNYGVRLGFSKQF